jgi:aryl-alcohol dehydrogenase-like predicted oxidoreductase
VNCQIEISLQYRNLGKKCGLKVSPICLGTAFFGKTIDETEGRKLIDRAIDNGINFIDTADIYGGGEAERIVGKAIKGRREDLIVVTKVLGRTGNGPNDEGLSRSHIVSALDRSLERLGTDYVDLYLLHDPDYFTPIEETLRTMDALVREGKVRYTGCCNFYAWLLMEALAVSEELNLERFVCTQPLYNIVNRDIEVDVIPLCQKYGIGVTPYAPIARGVLTGKYGLAGRAPPDSRVGRGDRRVLETEWREESFRVAEKIVELAKIRGMSASQFALGWVLANSGITSALVGPRNLEQLEDNLGALDFTITAEDERLVDELVPPGEHTGKGYHNPDYPVRGRQRPDLHPLMPYAPP